MSSHRGSGDRTPIRSIRQLVDHLATGERPRARWRVGTEYEKIAVLAEDGSTLRYDGQRSRPGIRTLLEEMASERGWRPEHDGDALVALRSDDGASITLEPGGQFELSGAPFVDIHETVRELRSHEAELAHLQEVLPVRWLWVGMDPLHGLDAIDWMPKRRYAIMRRYLPTRGGLAHAMMKATCTVQANVDYGDEGDMGRKLRTATAVSSLVTAIFANSPLKEGVPSGFKSYRAHIWSDTDPDRCGLLPWIFDGEPPDYERYARWALGVPLFFLVRGDDYVDCAGLPFERFMREGYEGHEATMEDWQLHLSTLFPDVRLKTYLELRSADCVKPPYLPALPALWKGVLYDEDALAAAWELTARWTFEERLAHRDAVAVDALAAEVPGARYGTADLARELLEIATWGLRRCAERLGHEDESPYLEPLRGLLARGESPADRTLAWYARTRPDARQICRHYEADWVDPD